jgi:hypothetical protein
MKSAVRSIIRFGLSHLPLKRGHAGIAHSRLGRALTGEYEPALVTHRSGTGIVVNTREFIGRTVAVTGDYDAAVTDVCTAVLRAGDNVVDIGGHCGVISFACAATLTRLGAATSGGGGTHGSRSCAHV